MGIFTVLILFDNFTDMFNCMFWNFNVIFMFIVVMTHGYLFFVFNVVGNVGVGNRHVGGIQRYVGVRHRHVGATTASPVGVRQRLL